MEKDDSVRLFLTDILGGEDTKKAALFKRPFLFERRANQLSEKVDEIIELIPLFDFSFGMLDICQKIRCDDQEPHRQ